MDEILEEMGFNSRSHLAKRCQQHFRVLSRETLKRSHTDTSYSGKGCNCVRLGPPNGAREIDNSLLFIRFSRESVAGRSAVPELAALPADLGS